MRCCRSRTRGNPASRGVPGQHCVHCESRGRRPQTACVDTTYLLVLQAEQQDFLHHGQLGLLAALGALADVARVEGNLVAILAGLVARLGAAVPDVCGRVGARAASLVAAFDGAQGAAASSTASCEPSRGHGGKRIMGREGEREGERETERERELV